MKSGHLRPSHRRFPLLHSPRNARALTRASHFDAGWSSPVARQAHNLKVVGSNPTPATKSRRPVNDLAAFAFFALGWISALYRTHGVQRRCPAHECFPKLSVPREFIAEMER